MMDMDGQRLYIPIFFIEYIDPLEKHHGNRNCTSDSFSCKLHGLSISQGLTLLTKRNGHVFL